jgi:hypothetical protein
MKHAILLALFLVISCGNNTEKNTDSKSNDPRVINTIYRTDYIAAKEIACNYENNQIPTPVALNRNLNNGVLTTSFDIMFEENLSKRIVKALKSSSELVKSENFWSLLPELEKNELNQYLVQNFGTYKDENFNLKRRQVAYAFTVLAEIENYDFVYVFKSQKNKQFEDFTVSFSYNLKQQLNLNFCNDDKIDQIKVPRNLLMPSHIASHVFCFDEYQQNLVRVQINRKQEMTIEFGPKFQQQKVWMNTNDIQVTDSSQMKRYRHKNENMTIQVEFYKKNTRNAYYDPEYRSYIYDSIRHMNFRVFNEQTTLIQLDRLQCKVLKPLIY